jgi:REP element-mobilizing transposase RayT
LDERTTSQQRPEDRIPPGSLGAVVRAFKSLSTKRVNARRGASEAKVWQRGYHEEVIRDEAGLARVREYILNNP